MTLCFLPIPCPSLGQPIRRRTMLKLLLPVLILSYWLMACGTNTQEESTTVNDARTDNFRMPAEWEPHEAVWLGWSAYRPAFYPGIGRLISTLTPHVTVRIAAGSEAVAELARQTLREQGLDTTNVEIFVLPGDRYWIRDNGANYLVNDRGEMAVADFNWDNYGRPEFLRKYYEGNTDSLQKYVPPILRSVADSLEANMAALEDLPVFRTELVHEGGNIEVNGKGTLIVCAAAVLDRNPGVDRAWATEEFKRVLGVEQVIWLEEGLADDPGGFYRRISGDYVGGGVLHADEFVRFANDSTILLAWVAAAERDNNPLNRLNYERMSANLKVLEAARNWNGRPFTIVKVPLPELIAEPILARPYDPALNNVLDIGPMSFIPKERPALGDTLLRVPAASYLNYLVTDGLVVLPTYREQGTSPQREQAVENIFARLFPDRKIVFIDFMPQNWDGGGIHCSTQQQPRVGGGR